MDPKREKTVSKFMSLVLRHEPEALGIALDEAGWSDLDAILAGLHAKFAVSREDVLGIVARDPKARYVIEGSRIRAAQGHSIDVDLNLAPRTPPARLFHGTTRAAWETIAREGLDKRERTHVHLSPDIETAKTVGNRRRGGLVILQVALRHHAPGWFCILSLGERRLACRARAAHLPVAPRFAVIYDSFPLVGEAGRGVIPETRDVTASPHPDPPHKGEGEEDNHMLRASVIVFPGSNCDRDVKTAIERITGFEPKMVWHGDASVPSSDLIVLPGGFSYGDYLRCGAMAAHSAVMKDVVAKAKAGTPVLGICNGFQILCESGLLPGALMRNASLHFICRDVFLKVENDQTFYTRTYRTRRGHQGADRARRRQLLRRRGYAQHARGRGPRRLPLLRRSAARFRPTTCPNGAQRNIAGICNETGRVLGMMPHPERIYEAASAAPTAAACSKARCCRFWKRREPGRLTRRAASSQPERKIYSRGHDRISTPRPKAPARTIHASVRG